MQNKYYLSHDGQQLGPFTVDETVAMLKAGELVVTDFIFDEQVNDWMILLEHPIMSTKIKEMKPAKPPPISNGIPSSKKQDVKSTAAKAGNPEEAEWFILKGENKYGPFTYQDIVRMLQEKVIFEFDFVWCTNLDNWKRVAELPHFGSDKIKELAGSNGSDKSNTFFRRRHKRVQFGGSIIVHDNKHVWKGQSIEISEGGAGIVMENAMILPGQKLYLHFKPGDGAPPFNATCEVVFKKYVDHVQSREAPMVYGIKFLSINENAQKFIQEFTHKSGNEKVA